MSNQSSYSRYIQSSLCSRGLDDELLSFSETTILEDSTLDTPDTPDTPGRCEETARDPHEEDEEEEDASTSEQASSDGQKEKNKKGKSSMKSKAHRPHHLKLPKAFQRSVSAQSNGNQQAKGTSGKKGISA